MKTSIYSLLILSFIVLAVFSCKKDEEDKDVTDEATQSIKDNADAQSVFDNIFTLVNDELNEAENGGNKSMDSGCPTVTVTWETDYISSITIDFGDTYCSPENSNDQYKGKLIATATGKYRDSLTVITTAFENFYVNDFHVEGSKTVTNLGRDTEGFINYSIAVENGKLTSPSGITKEWQSTRNRKWTQGENTVIWPFDDVYEITGNASGTNINGDSYTITVNNPLWVRVGCRFVQQGNLTVVTNNNSVIVDYGTYQAGVCDKTIIYTVNGTDYPYTVQ